MLGLVKLLGALALARHCSAITVDLIDSFTKITQLPGVPEHLKARNENTKYIFDVGFNNGDDADAFVGRGYTVVGVDADPTLIEQGLQRFSRLVNRSKLLLVHAGIEESVTTPLVFWKNKQVPVLSSFERKKACDDDGHNWECEATEVPLLRCEALWSLGKPEYLKVDIEERHFTCIRALVNLPRHLLPEYVSWEMHEFAKKMPYPLMDTQLILKLWELGYRWIKVVAQAEGDKSSAMPDEAANYLGTSNWWSRVEDILQRGIINPRLINMTRFDESRGQNITYQPWFDFHLKLDHEADVVTPFKRKKALQAYY